MGSNLHKRLRQSLYKDGKKITTQNKHDFKGWKAIPDLDGYLIKEDGTIGCIKPRNRNSKPPVKPRILKQRADHNGYIKLNIRNEGKKKTCFIHVLVARTYIGEKPNEYEVNHIDRDKSNNSLENLEYVTKRENRAHGRDNVTGYTGVYLLRGNYTAQIRIDRKLKHLGCFKTAEEGHKAYLNALASMGQTNKYSDKSVSRKVIKNGK